MVEGIGRIRAGSPRERRLRQATTTGTHLWSGEAGRETLAFRGILGKLPASPSLVRVDQHGTIRVDPDAYQSSGRDAERRAQTLALLRLNARRLRVERPRRWRDPLPVVREDMDRSALDDWVWVERLPGSNGLLPEFFTTGRSFCGSVGDGILPEPPLGWI